MTPERERASSLSERFYRVLLIAYPEEHRREYGPQMEQAFRDLRREALRRGGGIGLARLWMRTVSDLAATALAERSSRPNDEDGIMQDRRLAGIGFVLLIAPLFFVAAALLKYGAGVGLLFDPLEAFLSEPGRREVFNVISPVVFLGGLALALAANLYAVLRPAVNRENGAIVCVVRPEVKLANIAASVVSSLLLVTLVVYVFLENFTYR